MAIGCAGLLGCGVGVVLGAVGAALYLSPEKVVLSLLLVGVILWALFNT